MAQIYREGEIKIRPDVYYRYSNRGSNRVVATDGINAIVMKASWGPTGEVRSFSRIEDLRDAYGDCTGTDMAAAMFEEGIVRAYVYRVAGTSGAKATATIGTGVTITAKYEGTHPIKIKIQQKPGDENTMQAIVLVNTVVKETFDFDSSGSTNSDELCAALNKSVYVTAEAPETAEKVTAIEKELSGGADPTTTSAGYGAGYSALEPYYYNVICQDSTETDVQTLLAEYMEEIVKVGKFPFAVLAATDATFTDKLAKAKGFNNANIVCIGNSYVDNDGNTVDPVMAVARTAAAISVTPSDRSIVHKTISGASDIPEKYTNTQYEDAILNGLLLFSVSSDGQIWFDSGIDTLVNLAGNQDEGWKKIKRTKVRGELMYRLDTALEKKIGKINCDADGIADVIQTGSGILNDMAGEKKLATGGSFYLDEGNPATSDSAWFIIEADDIDTLEKIYLHYQFRAEPTA